VVGSSVEKFGAKVSLMVPLSGALSSLYATIKKGEKYARMALKKDQIPSYFLW